MILQNPTFNAERVNIKGSCDRSRNRIPCEEMGINRVGENLGSRNPFGNLPPHAGVESGNVVAWGVGIELEMCQWT